MTPFEKSGIRKSDLEVHLRSSRVRRFIYWKKFHYVKYVTELVKYAMKHDKPMALPRDSPYLPSDWPDLSF